MSLPVAQRRAYQQRLAQLDVSADRLSRLLMAADADETARLCLEAIDIEMDLLREVLGAP